MINKKILICGHKSFVATGLTDIIDKMGLTYDCFSRGDVNRNSNVVSGPVLDMCSNTELGQYDTVINFIIIKDQSVEDNIAYIKSLLAFCKDRGVRHLIQISSISVYPNTAEVVTEDSPIETDYHNKGGYAGVKVAIDHYLMIHPIEGLQVIFVRPGFIYAKNHDICKDGIVVSKFGLNVLLGNRKTTLPLISRERIHEALLKIVLSTEKKDVYLLLNPDKTDGTKYNFVCRQWNIKPICLPKWPFMLATRILKGIGVLKQNHYLKIVGLFKNTWFDSRETEKSLGMNLGKRTFAVLGAGTYGSYVSNLLSIVYPHEMITLFDVGDEHLKTEDEIGYLSHIVGAPYEGLQKARFFGFGGASVKWGGQMLTFTENDFANPTPFIQDIVNLDKKWKDVVLAKFGLENKVAEVRINEHFFMKTGIWLSYFHRNLFKYFCIIKNKKIHIKPNSRVTKIINENARITGVEYICNKEKKIACYDQYFLTAGAFESSRLLIDSGLAKEKDMMPFSDHLSQRAFKVKSGIKMGNEDFRFKVQGASLITKRFVGEIDGYSFYSQPICNEDFPFFKDLKKLLFGHELRLGIIMNIIKNIPSCIAFVWYMVVKKQMYVYNDEFYLQIDIEAPHESGTIRMNDEKDKFGERSVDVNLQIIPKTGELFTRARAYIKEYLDANDVKYDELPFSTSAEKYEDVYHPFGMFCDFKDANDYFTHFDNMLVVNTGVLPRAGGINSTCAVMPLVEEYVNCIMK